MKLVDSVSGRTGKINYKKNCLFKKGYACWIRSEIICFNYYIILPFCIALPSKLYFGRVRSTNDRTESDKIM